MDLPHIGAHCAHCRTLDLLPIRCPSCSQVFCSIHSPFAAHGCPEPVAALPLAETSSSTLVPAQPCELQGCDKPRMVIYDVRPGATEAGRDIACPACAGYYCIAHRAAHDCKPLPPTDAAARSRTRELIRETYGASTSSSSSSSTASKPSAPLPSAKRAKKNGSAAIELMRLRQFAKPGRNEVRERAERWHLRIEVDLRAEGAWTDPARREVDRKLEGTYWRRDLTAGQIKQATINRHGISYDPVDGDPSTFIHLVHIPPDGGSPVELGSTAPISSACEDGAWVVLVKGSAWQATR